MKVVVTQLKAPWPTGTKVGQVVDLEGCDSIPEWAVNKCTPAEADAKAASTWRKPGAVEKAPAKAKADKPEADAKA